MAWENDDVFFDKNKPWGNPNDADLKVELLNLDLSLNPVGVARLKTLYKQNKIYGFVLRIGVLILIAGFIWLEVSLSSKDDNDSFGWPLLLVGIGVSLLLLMIFLISTNKGSALKLFKNEFVLEELSPYVDNIQLQENEYTFFTNKATVSSSEDLTNCLTPEYVTRALGLCTEKCNENYVKEWITGVYHGTQFRFYEIKLLNVYTTGSGKNTERHETIVYNGQGYIFKTKIGMPFAVQYNFNPNCKELTVEKFYNAFNGFMYNQLYDSLTAKENLDEEEREFFDILEAREFKVCLLKLAMLFDEYGKMRATLAEEFIPNKLSVRLQNDNIIILREGAYDYFEIDLDHAIDLSLSKFSRELSEFVSVLETMASLALISG